MFNVLVTGGAGFIGSHVARELKDLGMKVVILDDLSGGFKENVPVGCTFVEGSILDRNLVKRLFDDHHFDFVFHLAAYAAENLSPHIKRFNFENNLIGSINLINASINHRIKCFVFTSSIAVYGNNLLPYCEHQVPMPIDSYGISKWTVEQELRICREFFGLNSIVFRPHNVYGPGQNIGDKYRNVIGIFINQAMKGQPLTIFGDGSQKRQFSYIGDIAPIMAGSVLDKRFHNDTFNIGSDQFFTVRHIAEEVQSKFPNEIPIKCLETRHEIHTAVASHYKLGNIINIPETRLGCGINRMVQWADIVGARESTPFKDIEIPRGLPEGWK